VVFLWQNLHKFRNYWAGPELAMVDRDGMVI